MRFALYARFSSDNQSDRSIDDQLALCRAFVAGKGGTIAATFTDYAISGAHAASRPALQDLLAGARAGRFDAVCAEALDRISRDQEDIAAIHKRLAFAGVPIVTVSEGEISELHIGLKGTMNALFLKDLAQKVRRGQAGRVAAGKAAGNRSYGYDVVREIGADGKPVAGERRINPAEAEVVRRIFREYAAGRTARQIAAALNRDGVPGPAGGQWSQSTINGSRARRSGLLWNDLYDGKLVWNRVRMVKDPETGRRLSRPNPPAEWRTTAVPELRIVDPETFAAARARKQRFPDRPQKHRAAGHLFAGLVTCGHCGAAYTIKQKGVLACSAHRDKGTCDNGRVLRIDALERRALAGLGERLLERDAISAYVAAYHAERARLESEAARARTAAAKKTAKLDAAIRRIVDAIADGTDTEAMRARLHALEAERADVETPAEPPPAVRLHPNAAALYRRRVAALVETLNTEGMQEEAWPAIRALVDRIEVRGGPKRGDVELTLHGDLATILAFANDDPAPQRGFALVAGEGLEPPTRGL